VQEPLVGISVMQKHCPGFAVGRASQQPRGNLSSQVQQYPLGKFSLGGHHCPFLPSVAGQPQTPVRAQSPNAGQGTHWPPQHRPVVVPPRLHAPSSFVQVGGRHRPFWQTSKAPQQVPSQHVREQHCAAPPQLMSLCLQHLALRHACVSGLQQLRPHSS
jgi:hypothetical protein